MNQPTSNKRRVAYTTKDAHEVMWTQRIRDSCGNSIGPYFTKSDVGKTVNFLKSFLNPEDCKHAVEEGINDYIDRFIVDCPDRLEYIPFVQYYQLMIECSDFKHARVGRLYVSADISGTRDTSKLSR